MKKNGRLNILLGQDCKYIVLSIVSEYQWFLFLFSEKDRKECICQINDLMPHTQGCVNMPHKKYHSSNQSYYLLEFAIVNYRSPGFVWILRESVW